MARVKNRGQNWQIAERNHLLEVIAERINILQNKKQKTDIKTNEEKKKAWEEITGLLQAKFGQKWSTAQIVDQWKRLRINAKKEMSSYQKECQKTGGGPPPVPPSSISTMIKDMCPQDFLQMRNPFDDDASVNNEAVTVLEFLSGGTGGGATPTECNKRPPGTVFVAPDEIEDDPFFEELSSDIERRAPKRTASSGSAQASPRKKQSYEELMVELVMEQHRVTLQHMQREHELRMEVIALEKLTQQKKLEAAIASLSKD
ncbi:uncharacterized protein [Diadema setosum]|uniref:uncharacterized protein n=1 Tax=Diadema setosum TaxID=31175 RepID=UPI003B3AA24B